MACDRIVNRRVAANFEQRDETRAQAQARAHDRAHPARHREETVRFGSLDLTLHGKLSLHKDPSIPLALHLDTIVKSFPNQSILERT